MVVSTQEMFLRTTQFAQSEIFSSSVRSRPKRVDRKNPATPETKWFLVGAAKKVRMRKSPKAEKS